METSSRLVFDNERLYEADFSGRKVAQFSSHGSIFEYCNFSSVRIGSATFGSGTLVSKYIGCNFNEAALKMGPAGYARFENCSFENTHIQNWHCLAVEVVDCVFSGRLQKVSFNGTVPADKARVAGRETNEFHDNDFLRATFADVGFRTGIDLERQKLPRGAGFTYLPNAAASLEMARTLIKTWESGILKRQAESLLNILDDEVRMGQRQLIVRVADYPTDLRESLILLLDAAQKS